MTVVDVVILFVILLSALFSLLRGFVKEAVSLTTWLLAIWISSHFSSKLAPMLPMDSEAVRQVAGFGLLFIMTLLIGVLVNIVIARFIKKTGLSSADRLLGVVFGLLRGVLIIVVFVVIGGMTPLPQQEWWQSSGLLKRFEGVAVMLKNYFPDDMMSFDKVQNQVSGLVSDRVMN
jgi:membrane protein required for colicin V production